MSDEKLQDLRYRLERRILRSSFSKYLSENFEAFEAIRREVGTRWDTIAKWAMDSDLTGGKRLTPQAAKKTYERISAEHNRKAKAARAGDAVRDGTVQLGPGPKPSPSSAEDPLLRITAKLRGIDKRTE